MSSGQCWDVGAIELFLCSLACRVCPARGTWRRHANCGHTGGPIYLLHRLQQLRHFHPQVSTHLAAITLSHPNTIHREFQHQAPTISRHILMPTHRNSEGTNISSTLANQYSIITSISQFAHTNSNCIQQYLFN